MIFHFQPRVFGAFFNSQVQKALAIAVAAAVFASVPTAAQAGLIRILLDEVAEHTAEPQVGRKQGDHGNSPLSVPGLDGPLVASSNQGFASCVQLFPNGTPIDVAAVNPLWRAVGLCSNHFAVLNSELSKTPLVVVERLNRTMLFEAKGEERTNEFYADPRLARGTRAELVDYKSSGLDRGHLASAGNQPDQQSMIQSFALSNMVPQDPYNNRKTWAKIESDVRKFVRRAQGDVFVFSGPIFRGEQRMIGPDQVWVPSHLFKLVYDEASGRSWAYILANTAEARLEAPVDYTEFVKQTGWQLLRHTPG